MLTLSQELFCSAHHFISKKAEDRKKLEGDRARTADPYWPKGYSVLHAVVRVHNLGGKLTRSCCSRTGWAPFGRWWALYITCFGYSISSININVILSPLGSVLLKHLYVCPHFFSFFPHSSVPHPTGMESKWLTVWYLATCRVKPW